MKREQARGRECMERQGLNDHDYLHRSKTKEIPFSMKQG